MIERKALLHWLNNPSKALVNDLFITPIIFCLLTIVCTLMHPDIILLVNFVKISVTWQLSLIVYLYVPLVSQLISFMMKHCSYIVQVPNKIYQCTIIILLLDIILYQSLYPKSFWICCKFCLLMRTKIIFPPLCFCSLEKNHWNLDECEFTFRANVNHNKNNGIVYIFINL